MALQDSRRLHGLVSPAVLFVVVLTLPLTAAGEIREGETATRIILTTNGRVLPPEEHTRLRVFVHEDRPSHQTRLPVCQPTRNDALQTFVPTGWHLPTGGLGFLVDERSAPSAIRANVGTVLDRAAETWRSADAEKVFTRLGTIRSARPRYDGKNTVAWRSLSGRTIAAAYVWYFPSTGEVLDADIAFSTRAKWVINDPAAGDCGGVSGFYDLQAVATHEIGHWIGLDDLSDATTEDLTMHGIVTHGETKKSTLGAGDRLGAQTVAP